MKVQSEDKSSQISSLAKDVLTLSRNTLLINLRFLDMALSQFEFVEYSGTLATDGQHFIYDPKYILKSFKDDKNSVTRKYLHLVLHCVFRHMYIHTLVNHQLWNLACDIAIENIINNLELERDISFRVSQQQNYIKELKNHVKYITAELIYSYFMDSVFDAAYIEKYSLLFKEDDHSIWYLSEEKKVISGSLNTSDVNRRKNDPESDSDQKQTAHEESSGTRSEQEQEWEKISKRMQTDMEIFQKERFRSDQSLDLVQNLKEVNREKYDYTAFLKKFAVRGEAMRLDPDEFDYIFYDYGMKMYGNMPLIEPLEYREVKRIREFAIAIDTSASTSGYLVQTFIQKTYNILKSTDSFYSKVNIHIIQCDTEIKEDAVITSQEEFDQYLRSMRIRGGGGTDFRPVFTYVDELIRRHDFSNLKGLIYFTDGYGVYPEKKPKYETAFVFVDDGVNEIQVPAWAIKLVLRPDELKERTSTV